MFWVVLVGEFLVQSVDRSFWVCFSLVLWIFCVFIVWLGWFFFFCDVHVVALEASASCWTGAVLAAYCVSRILLYKILENHIGK